MHIAPKKMRRRSSIDSIGYVYSSRHQGRRGSLQTTNATFASGDGFHSDKAATTHSASKCISIGTGSSASTRNNRRTATVTCYSDRILYCSCKGGDIQREIDCLRESSDCALHQTYDEVEELTERSKAQEAEIVLLTKQLKESKKREAEKTRQYENAKKKVLLARGGGDTSMGGMIKSSSSASSIASTASYALQKISSHHSFSSIFTLKSNSSTNTQTSTNSTSPSLNGLKRSVTPMVSEQSFGQRSHTSISSTRRGRNNNNNNNAESSSVCTQNARWEATDNPEVQSLIRKLEVRKREISSLEELVNNNVKDMQELQLKLQKKHECEKHEYEYCVPVKF